MVLAFSSGMGAVATTIMALCSTGDHIVAQRHIYSGTQLFLQAPFPALRHRRDVRRRHRAGVPSPPPSFRVARCCSYRTDPRTRRLATRRPRRDRRDQGSDHGRRLDVRGTDRPASDRARRRPRVALSDEGHRGAQRCDARRRLRWLCTPFLDSIWAYSALHGVCASPFDALNGLRGIRTLPVRHARQSETARPASRLARDASGGVVCALPRARLASAARSGEATDDLGGLDVRGGARGRSRSGSAVRRRRRARPARLRPSAARRPW